MDRRKVVPGVALREGMGGPALTGRIVPSFHSPHSFTIMQDDQKLQISKGGGAWFCCHEKRKGASGWFLLSSRNRYQSKGGYALEQAQFKREEFQ
jgi:hypothetical protein